MTAQYRLAKIVAALSAAAAALVVLALTAVWYHGTAPLPAVGTADEAKAESVAFDAEPIRPLPRTVTLDTARVALGSKLFHDARLSHDDSISCSSCHKLDEAGIDGQAVAVGIGGKTGGINTPTVFNSSFNFVQFWNGRAPTLEEQAAGPVHNPIEMGSNWNEVIGKLKLDAYYRSTFASLYPEGITAEAIVDAIATFERSLITPDSPFDRYLRGDKAALTERQLGGYRLFKDFGCASCHQGINVGGNLFAGLGVFGDFFRDRQKDTADDQGRFAVTGKETDRHFFKVPSLRNVARTAPYFHDGSVRTLPEAVRLMGKYQLGRELSVDEVEAIEDFLRTLTGRYLGESL